MNIKELKEEYPFLNRWSDKIATILYEEFQEKELINEFLYTIEINKTIKHLLSKFGDELVIEPVRGNNRISFIDITFNNILSEKLNDVNKIMDSFGWYPAFISDFLVQGGKYSTFVDKFKNRENITISYEAKYDEEVDISMVNHLYHICPDLKWSKIHSMGLTPKDQGKLANHPNRIYLMTAWSSTEDLHDLSRQLLDKYPNKDKVKEMYLLEIDASYLKDKHFFEDPNFHLGEAVWTYQNIPPKAIKILEKITV